MKTQAVVVLVTFLLLATLVTESNAFGSSVPKGKREVKV